MSSPLSSFLFLLLLISHAFFLGSKKRKTHPHDESPILPIHPSSIHMMDPPSLPFPLLDHYPIALNQLLDTFSIPIGYDIGFSLSWSAMDHLYESSPRREHLNDSRKEKLWAERSSSDKPSSTTYEKSNTTYEIDNIKKDPLGRTPSMHGPITSSLSPSTSSASVPPFEFIYEDIPSCYLDHEFSNNYPFTIPPSLLSIDDWVSLIGCYLRDSYPMSIMIEQLRTLHTITRGIYDHPQFEHSKDPFTEDPYRQYKSFHKQRKVDVPFQIKPIITIQDELLKRASRALHPQDKTNPNDTNIPQDKTKAERPTHPFHHSDSTIYLPILSGVSKEILYKAMKRRIQAISTYQPIRDISDPKMVQQSVVHNLEGMVSSQGLVSNPNSIDDTNDRIDIVAMSNQGGISGVKNASPSMSHISPSSHISQSPSSIPSNPSPSSHPNSSMSPQVEWTPVYDTPSFFQDYEGWWCYWQQLTDQFYGLVQSKVIDMDDFINHMILSGTIQENAILYMITQCLCMFLSSTFF